MAHRTNENCLVSEQKILFGRRWKVTLLSVDSEFVIYGSLVSARFIDASRYLSRDSYHDTVRKYRDTKKVFF